MINFPEYSESEKGNEILYTGRIPDDLYRKIQEYTVIVCHDVFIKTTIGKKSGILLVKRLVEPAKGEMWPVGGRILRGLNTEDSLRKKVQDECNLTLSDMEYLGAARTMFHGDIYGHGRGSDTLNLFYWAKSDGKIKLDSLHESPMIVTEAEYPMMRDSLAPYVRDCIDIILKRKLW
ncbi:MAG: hypothetical protein AAB719_02705 [Patescibacteria group bacterium]